MNQTEFNRLQNLLQENPRMSGKQMLTYIEENLVSGNATAKRSIKEDLKDGVIEIFPNGRPETNQPTRKREIEQGFKVRTKSESEVADQVRRTPKIISE